MMTSQSRPSTTQLVVGLTVAFGVGLSVVGCSSEHPTPSGASTSGTISTTAAQGLVDVAAVWASHPMPPCPRVIVGNQSAPAGLELPSDDSVAAQLADVMSPAPESWVREKLGWVTQALSVTRADIIDNSDAGDANSAENKGFQRYVGHVKDELKVGHDIANDVDGDYPEGCR
ncbi:hypothetical protein [Mycobacteroides abscessus]|uniref:hypothetical protein n=1 Tax=Mycobacteroides abscessus TaxID=36809 RepID=UPI0009A86722|nr:hypothetical protein [Mycobacteroides abscessus]SKP38434.1 Uncharacterised protein [Mycobacteroides abscessus subsp. abscessus]